jgi:DNA-binding transcriptional LysR family regulator
LERLRAHELDAAILGNIEDGDRHFFAVRRLSRHRMCVVLPEDHALAGKRTIKLSALARQPWISLSDAFYPGRRDFMRRIGTSAGFEPQIVSEVDSLSMMLGAVSAGDGAALLPEHTQKLPHSGCVFVKIASPVPMTELLLVQANTKPSVELSTLSELIAERAARTWE